MVFSEEEADGDYRLRQKLPCDDGDDGFDSIIIDGSSSSDVRAEAKEIKGISYAALAGALLGTALEWYDFALFGYFASEIGTAFFPPAKRENSQLLRAFVVFGGAFLMRPFGGLCFGHVADKAVGGSRKGALI